MTDTGRFPGEGQPEAAGGQRDGGQPEYPVHGSYPYGSTDGMADAAAAAQAHVQAQAQAQGPDLAAVPGMTSADADVLLPGSQGAAWGEALPADAAHGAHGYQQPQVTGEYDVYGQQVPYPQQDFHDPYAQADPYAQHQTAHVQAHQAQPPVQQVEQPAVQQPEQAQQYDAAAAAVHEPGPHETDGRDSGAIDVAAVRNGKPEAPTPARGTPRAPAPPRRPLHLGPPEPEQSGAVRPLSDRGLNRPGGKRKRKSAPAPGPDAEARTQGQGQAPSQAQAQPQSQDPSPAQSQVQGPAAPAQEQVQVHAQQAQQPQSSRQQAHISQPQGEAPAAQGEFGTAGVPAYEVGGVADTGVPQESPETLPGPQLGAFPPHDQAWTEVGTPAEGVPAAVAEAPAVVQETEGMAPTGAQPAAPAPENVEPQPVPAAEAAAVPAGEQLPQEAVSSTETPPQAAASPESVVVETGQQAPRDPELGPEQASQTPELSPEQATAAVPADGAAAQQNGEAAQAVQQPAETVQEQAPEPVPAAETTAEPEAEQPQAAHAGAPEPEAAAAAVPEEQLVQPKPGSGRRRRRRAKEPSPEETGGSGNTWVSAPGSTAVEAIEPQQQDGAEQSAGEEGSKEAVVAPVADESAATIPAQQTHENKGQEQDQQAGQAQQDEQPQQPETVVDLPTQQPRSAEAPAAQNDAARAADATAASPVAVQVAEAEAVQPEPVVAEAEAAPKSESAELEAEPEAMQPQAATTVPRQGGKHGRPVEDTAVPESAAEDRTDAPAPGGETPPPAADTTAPAEPTVEGAAVSVPADQPSEEGPTAAAAPEAVAEAEAAAVPQQAQEPQLESSAATEAQPADASQPEPVAADAETAAAPQPAASPESTQDPEPTAPAEAEPADPHQSAAGQQGGSPTDASESPQPAEDQAPEDQAHQESAEPGAPAEPAEPAGPPAPGYADAEREAVHRLMRERRDIRNGFRPDPIPHDVLLRVLEAAHTAPSVGHSQPWDFVVIRSEETRRAMHQLAEKQRHAYAESLPKARKKQFKELKIEAILDTPVNIVVTADPTRGGRHTLGRHTQPQMAPYSSALAVENLWLAARAEGLGVGWVSFFDEREMVRALELPEHLEVVAYLCVGYVDEFPPEPELAQAGWSKRRPLSWVVHEESYGRRVLPGAEPQDLLSDTVAAIRPLDAKALGEAWERQKRMTKPSGALGMLEIISAQLCGLSRKCPPPIPEPAAVAIFAGDHGVHAQGVTPWPQEVTGQMVGNFLGGGAVCNAFANQVGAEVCVIDVGVAGELPSTPGLLPRKIRAGTDDMTQGPAMTRDEALRAVEVGIETARDLVAAGNKAILTGEMGIANTTASAVLVAACTGAEPSEVTGRGTGINDETHARKVDVVRRALELHQPDTEDPLGMLAAVGGLEHAALVGLILGGASLRTPVILDGVSAGAAALVARCIAPEALAACIAGHRSSEPGHVAALTKLGLRPLVDLDLRLGEGTGALLSLPLVQSAARAMHEVATFDSAGVTGKS